MSRRPHVANGDPANIAAEAPPTDPSRDDESEPERRLPVHVVRYGPIKGSVWANYGPDGSVRYGVTFCRLYRLACPDAAREEWAVSYSYGPRDLPLLEKVAAACFYWIARRQADHEVPF